MATLPPGPGAESTQGAASASGKRKNPYRDVLTVPNAARFSYAGAIARLPISMLGIGIVLMIQGIYDSYAMAGRISAAFIIAGAVANPIIARLVDQRGQAKVMRPLVFVTSSATIALIVCAVLRVPEGLLYPWAVLAGGTLGSYGAMVRARWTLALRGDPKRLHTAYSLEAAFDEIVFILGPVIATLLATNVTSWAGLTVPILAVLVGGLWFLSQRGTEPPAAPRTAESSKRSVILAPGVWVVVLVFVVIGMIFGAADLATIAFTEEQGRKDLAGIVLAVFAVGSLISGLAYGVKHWLSPLWLRFVIGVCALAVGVCLFFFAHSIPVLMGIMFVTGFAIAPTLVNGNALVQLLVPADQLTEALAWISTAMGIGVSLGSAVGGLRIDDGGSHAGFQVVIMVAALAVITTLGAARTLRNRSTRPVAAGSVG